MDMECSTVLSTIVLAQLVVSISSSEALLENADNISGSNIDPNSNTIAETETKSFQTHPNVHQSRSNNRSNIDPNSNTIIIFESENADNINKSNIDPNSNTIAVTETKSLQTHPHVLQSRSNNVPPRVTVCNATADKAIEWGKTMLDPTIKLPDINKSLPFGTVFLSLSNGSFSNLQSIVRKGECTTLVSETSNTRTINLSIGFGELRVKFEKIHVIFFGTSFSAVVDIGENEFQLDLLLTNVSSAKNSKASAKAIKVVSLENIKVMLNITKINPVDEMVSWLLSQSVNKIKFFLKMMIEKFGVDTLNKFLLISNFGYLISLAFIF